MPPQAYTYYQLLQVDPEASPEIIEAAYRRLAKLYHPDYNASAKAIARMQELNAVYAVLKDPLQRRVYDQKLALKRQPLPTKRQLLAQSITQYNKTIVLSAAAATLCLFTIFSTPTTTQNARVEHLAPAQTAEAIRIRQAVLATIEALPGAQAVAHTEPDTQHPTATPQPVALQPAQQDQPAPLAKASQRTGVASKQGIKKDAIQLSSLVPADFDQQLLSHTETTSDNVVYANTNAQGKSLSEQDFGAKSLEIAEAEIEQGASLAESRVDNFGRTVGELLAGADQPQTGLAAANLLQTESVNLQTSQTVEVVALALDSNAKDSTSQTSSSAPDTQIAIRPNTDTTLAQALGKTLPDEVLPANAQQPTGGDAPIQADLVQNTAVVDPVEVSAVVPVAPVATAETTASAAEVKSSEGLGQESGINQASIEEEASEEAKQQDSRYAELLLPEEGIEGGGPQHFEWRANFVPDPGHGFELVFWRPGAAPMSESFGLAAPTVNSSLQINLDDLDDSLGNFFDSGEYRWGVLYVRTTPSYKRVELLSAERNYYFSNFGTNGSSKSRSSSPTSGE